MKSLLLDPTVVLMSAASSVSPVHATPGRLHRSPLDTYSTVLEKAGSYFDSHVARFLNSLELVMTTECDVRVRDLVHRLDWNGFYTSSRASGNVTGENVLLSSVSPGISPY